MMMTSDNAAFVIHALLPLSFHPPSTRSARIEMAAKSLPAPGSVSAVEPSLLPDMRSDRKRPRWLSAPSMAILVEALAVLTRLNANGIEVSHNTSMTRSFSLNVNPSPPSSTGTSMASRPSLAASRKA